MKIERWILVEALAALQSQRDQLSLTALEGEHKYPLKEGRKYEQCDLWWKTETRERWVEVKTIVCARSGVRGSIEEVEKDLSKRGRLLPHQRLTSLVLLFPATEGVTRWCESRLQTIGRRPSHRFKDMGAVAIEDLGALRAWRISASGTGGHSAKAESDLRS